MEYRTLSFSPIYYKRKVYDEGVILGSRPWKWTLGNKYSPCIARRIDDNLQMSSLSPHKQNFSVYISKNAITLGDEYTILNHEYGKERLQTQVKVIEIGANWCKVEVLQEDVVKYEKKKTITPVIETQEGKPFLFSKEWETAENLTKTISEEEQTNLEELMAFFEHPDKEQPQTDPGALPAKVSPEVIEDIDKETLSLPSPRIMLTENFVNGKNQRGFGFIMVNEGKLQQSLFTLPEQTTPQIAPEEPKKRESPVKVQAKPPERKPVKIEGFSNEEIAILDAIGKGAEHIDGIIQKSGLNAGLVAGMLLMLEMKDRVKQKPGRYFIRT